MRKLGIDLLVGLAVLAVVCAGKAPEDLTSEEKNKLLVEVAIGAVNAGDWEALRELYSPNFVMHVPGHRESIYWKEFELGCRMAKQFFNEMSYNIEDIIAEGDKVVVRMSSSIAVTTHFGKPYETKKKIEGTEIDIFRIKEGRIVEEWCEYDYTSIEAKLKAIMAGRMFR